MICDPVEISPLKENRDRPASIYLKNSKEAIETTVSLQLLIVIGRHRFISVSMQSDTDNYIMSLWREKSSLP